MLLFLYEILCLVKLETFRQPLHLKPPWSPIRLKLNDARKFSTPPYLFLFSTDVLWEEGGGGALVWILPEFSERNTPLVLQVPIYNIIQSVAGISRGVEYVFVTVLGT